MACILQVGWQAAWQLVGRTAMLLALAVLANVSNRALADAPTAAQSYETVVLPFLATTCFECHNAKREQNDLNLTDYQGASSITEHRDVWEKLLRRLKSGEMPPKESPRPAVADVQAVADFIEQSFNQVDAAAKPKAGRVTARRLNRAQYNYTVRDLLGVDLRPADDFPQDDAGYGFDNIADVLTISPVLMEKYLKAAERVARTAVFGPEPMKPLDVVLAPPLRSKADGALNVTHHGPQNYTYENYDRTGLTMPSSLHAMHRFPVDGKYVLRALPAGYRPTGSDPMKMALWVDGQKIGEAELGGVVYLPRVADVGGQTREAEATISAGDHWVAATFLAQFDGWPAAFGGPNPTSNPEPPLDLTFFEPRPDSTPEQLKDLAKFRKTYESHAEVLKIIGLYMNKLDIIGPYEQPTGPSPESVRKIYACGHLDGRHEPGCEHEIIANLVRRAFRHPVSEKEIGKYVALAALPRKQGESFEEGLCLAIQAILVAPDFLFRRETSTDLAGTHSQRTLNDHELASRISYFLWSSMPDDELSQCADRGALRQPAVLAAQVRRMLSDKKSQALVEEFGGQWLHLRGLESVKPDRDRYPDFEDYLRISMRRETELFFEHIVREDRSILDFLDGKYTFVNERLAQHYGISGVRGPEFRKVDLAGTPRAGVLTHASVLTVSSYATRTSPVLRGKWILENVLNAPPPPPPPNIPSLDESKIGSSVSMREQLEQHRSNPSCNACHSRMDPLGIGLENFDGIGLWRTSDGDAPIDASGSLPDGRSFQNPQELLAILKADRREFAQCLTEKMLTFALGRGLVRYDRRSVKEIVDRLEADDYRFSSLVLRVVNSLPFQAQQVDGDK